MSSGAPLHVDDQLAALALGTLPDPEVQGVERHLAGCPRCRQELDRTEAVLASLPLPLPPIAPSPAARAALLAAVAGGGRLARFAAEVARLLRLPLDTAAEVLDRLDAPEAWAPLPLPGAEGLSFFVPPLGPGLADATIAFLRLPPGGRFPQHTHLGPEQVLVLQGGYVDEASQIEYGPGDLHEEAVGSSHGFVAVDGPDCLCLGLVLGKIRVGDRIL